MPQSDAGGLAQGARSAPRAMAKGINKKTGAVSTISPGTAPGVAQDEACCELLLLSPVHFR